MKGVAGATGVLGSMIASRMLASGESVRVLVRSEQARGEWEAKGASAVIGDMKEPSSLDALCEGIEALVTTANAIHRGGQDSIEAVDVEGNRNLVEAANRNGVGRFVFISALAADLQSPAPLMKAKAVTEAFIRSSGIEYTILSPEAFMEVWVTMIIGAPLKQGRPVTLIGEGSRRHPFVSAEDVADFAVATAGSRAAANRQIAIGGPQAWSWREIVREAESILGKKVDLEFRAPGQPLPGFEEPLATGLGLMMAGFEQRDVVIPMETLYEEFKVKPKGLRTFLEGLLV